MGRDAGQALRELCSDHYHGLLTTSIYRQQRAELMDAIVLGGVLPTHVRAAPLPFGSSAITQTNTVRKAVSSPNPDLIPPRTDSGPSRLVLIRAGMVLLALIGVSLIWMWVTGPDAERSMAQPAEEQQPVQELGGEHLAEVVAASFVSQFLDGPEAWTAAGVSSFLYEWDRLTPGGKQVVRDSHEFEDFKLQLRERVQDERRLGSTLETGGTLEQFAGLLQIDLGLPPLPTPTGQRTVAGVTAPEAAESTVPPAALPAAASQPSETPAVAVLAVPKTSSADKLSMAVQVPAVKTAAAVEPSATRPAPSLASNCSARLAKVTVIARRACDDLLPGGTKGPPLMVVPAGSFQMGADDDPSARPSRTVRVSAPFAIARFEITAGEYAVFCQAAGRTCPTMKLPGPDYPVVGVTWGDATEYARWLSEQTGQAYRLPTEAEWEYAARAGSTARYSSGEQASPGQIRFAAKQPLSRRDRFGQNAWGLSHMLGNVREWVADGWYADYNGAPADAAARPAAGPARVVRGGSFMDQETRVRSAAREPLPADSADDHTGFRVVRAL